MPKRLTIPPDLFTDEEMDLINRATYKTERRIMLKSKRKFLREDAEAWLLANAVAYHHYKQVKIPITDCIIDFQSKFTGEDPAGRARSIIELGMRVNEAFYRGPSISGESEDEPVSWQILSWCDRCNTWHLSLRRIMSGDDYNDEGNIKDGIKALITRCPKERIGYGYKPPKEVVTIDWEGDEDGPVSETMVEDPRGSGRGTGFGAENDVPTTGINTSQSPEDATEGVEYVHKAINKPAEEKIDLGFD